MGLGLARLLGTWLPAPHHDNMRTAQERNVAVFARWCFRHRIVVVIAWLAVRLSVVGVERAVGSAYSNTFTLPGTASLTRAARSSDR